MDSVVFEIRTDLTKGRSMTTDKLIHVDGYRERHYAVHCEPSALRPDRWSVWVEIFQDKGLHPDKLCLSAEHAYNFNSYDDGKAAGICFAQQLIDAEFVQ